MNRLARARRSHFMMLALAVQCCACADLAGDPGIAQPDIEAFAVEVWPILLRDCGFSECHGGEPRFYRVVGPGHERLDPLTRLTAPVTDAEIQLSYDRARSMLNVASPNDSPLLLKPLSVEAGGSEHEGTDGYGRNVYRSVDDPSFQILVRWALGAASSPREVP